MIKIEAPFTKDKLKKLKAGDKILLSGVIYTARDQAHKRMCEKISSKERLPFEIENSAIYYCGPSPAKPGEAIGSAGPTTSYRMDDYTPELLDLGQSLMIGKGPRGKAVLESIKKNLAVYFAAVGGAGAYMARCIKEAEIIAYDDMGTEAIRKLKVVDMPLIVAIDSRGNTVYDRR